MGTLLEFIKKQKLKKLNGLAVVDKPDDDQLVYINNAEEIKRARLHEYNIWYQGDGDELLNYYTFQTTFEFNFEPWYSRNKKNYFWSLSSEEAGIKRTHSGQPRNIIDTLVSILPFPIIRSGIFDGETDNIVNDNLQAIIKDCDLEFLYKNEQLPMTLVEGWGCWKINWDKDFSDYPVPIYYRAENVDFIYKMGKIFGVIFRDYYTNGKKRYVLIETRTLEPRTEADGSRIKVLCIEKKLFTASDRDVDYINEVDFSEVPELSDIERYVEIGPVKHTLFAVPCIFYENTSKLGGYGRSVFCGKIDLFDDLDLFLSQLSNAGRLSTPIEYMNSDFLERDENGMPRRPKSFDRKYVMYVGGRTADGSTQGDPVQITQPQLNFGQYSDAAIQTLLQIINGILSPATLGIDIAKKDNAEAQREKEKVTIFTRNTIVHAQERIYKQLCSELLVAYEFMTTGEITHEDYDISVRFNEFADESFENKIKTLGAAYDNMEMSDEMYLQKLYGNSISDAERARELKWLKENHSEPRTEGMTGAGGGGANLPGMKENMMSGGEGFFGDDENNEEMF